jgi:DNA-binding NarL/FixJ family response regulator
VTELAFFGGDVGDGSAAVQPPYGDEPYGLLAAGRWAEAAELWKELGCPYEHALALGESGDPEAMLQALEQLDALGAVPLAARVRRGLRGLGVAKVPRGPQRSTRDNPAGLTARQLDVLALLVRGQTNAEIAHQLVISVRTADNHVSAVLDKLGVGRRAEAAARATELGLLER